MLNSVKYIQPLEVASWTKPTPAPAIKKAPIYDVETFSPAFEKSPYQMERKPLAVERAQAVKRSITREREPLEITKQPIETKAEPQGDTINILGRNFKTSHLFLAIASIGLYYTIKGKKK